MTRSEKYGTLRHRYGVLAVISEEEKMALENVFSLSWNQAVGKAFFSNLEKYQLLKLLALSNSADKLIQKRYNTHCVT